MDSPLSRRKALRMMEASYLAAAAALIWLALYYFPVGGSLFRLALPLPLALLLVRRGGRAGLEGMAVAILLLVVLMGPVRGPLMLFPYGFLSVWLGWCWQQRMSWWVSWGLGVIIGAAGFLVRLVALSLMVGENLWVVITRAGAGLLDRILDLMQLPLAPDLFLVQTMAIALVLVQQLIYVLALHALAYWIFPRLQAPIPEPPPLLHGLVALDPL